jgi:uncharacterized alkaline shock family protein YloU
MLFSDRFLLVASLCTNGWLMLYSGSAEAQPTTPNRATIQMGGAVQSATLTQGKVVTTLASKARGAVVDGPQGITTDGVHLYFVDPINNTVSKIAIATGVVTRIAGSLTTQAWGYVDGPGSVANFKRPQGITTDGTNLYIADTFNHVIRKMVIATGVVSTLSGRWNSAGAMGSDDGPAKDASFSSPRGITTDGSYLYVADTGNQTVRKITIATGAVTTLAGTPGAIGSADGIGAAARFDSLTGITTDGTNVYVADVKNNAIRKIVIATGSVTTLAGQAGTYGFEDGVGTKARFTGPHGVVTDGTNVFVADTFNQTIRRIVIATGVVTTIAGIPGVTGKVDGLGRNATFSRPSSLTNDGTYLYVSDLQNSAIRIVE